MRLREKSQLKKNQYKIQFLTNPILKDEIGKKKLIKKKLESTKLTRQTRNTCQESGII